MGILQRVHTFSPTFENPSTTEQENRCDFISFKKKCGGRYRDTITVETWGDSETVLKDISSHSLRVSRNWVQSEFVLIVAKTTHCTSPYTTLSHCAGVFFLDSTTETVIITSKNAIFLTENTFKVILKTQTANYTWSHKLIEKMNPESMVTSIFISEEEGVTLSE